MGRMQEAGKLTEGLQGGGLGILTTIESLCLSGHQNPSFSAWLHRVLVEACGIFSCSM